MRLLRFVLLAALLIGAVEAIRPQTGGATADSSEPTAAILAVLNRQVADWNRGDLEAFATGYKNSPDILFIGKHVSRGYAGMLASYKAGYGTREKMGTLSFAHLEVQPLDASFATVTGEFALTRTAAGGGNASGHFLLVMEGTAAGWKIVRDDSTADIPAATATQGAGAASKQ